MKAVRDIQPAGLLLTCNFTTIKGPYLKYVANGRVVVVGIGVIGGGFNVPISLFLCFLSLAPRSYMTLEIET